MVFRIQLGRLVRLGALTLALGELSLTSACASFHMPDLHLPEVPGAASASSAPPPPSPGEEPSTTGKLSLDSPIDRIVATPGGKALLDRDVSGLVERPEYPLFKSMSLRKVASMSNGKITQQTLDRVNEDLAQLSASSAQR